MAPATVQSLSASCLRLVRNGTRQWTWSRFSSHTAYGSQRAESKGKKGLILTAGFIGGAISVWQVQRLRGSAISAQLPPSMSYADKATMCKTAIEIASKLGADSVSMDPDDLEHHGYSEWSTSNSNNRPIAVVYPRSTQEVSIIARICNEHRTPMIPFAAGSSVEGNFAAPFSGICIDVSRMDKIIAIREEDLDVTVQAGVALADLNEELKDRGLYLPIDPSPTARIGGMISTNASGPHAFRYGTMKDWVVNLTVVLADGTVIKTRRRPRKTSAGYNLNSLFSGSEGTLGIITEATVKLAAVPNAVSVATASFASVRDAAAAASRMVRDNIPLLALELLDHEQMKIINKNGGAGGRMWKEEATLFLKFGGNASSIKEDATRAQNAVKLHGGSGFQQASSQKDIDSLWAARKEALWAMLAVRPEGTQIWSTDVAVPISQLANMIELSSSESSRLGLYSSVLGHVGDGNFHQSIMYNPDVPEQKEAVRHCVNEMIVKTLEMDGTVSGEHGIGLGKKHCLAQELSPETMNVMRTLKRSLDPHWVLNPGKVFDEPEVSCNTGHD